MRSYLNRRSATIAAALACLALAGNFLFTHRNTVAKTAASAILGADFTTDDADRPNAAPPWPDALDGERQAAETAAALAEVVVSEAERVAREAGSSSAAASAPGSPVESVAPAGAQSTATPPRTRSATSPTTRPARASGKQASKPTGWSQRADSPEADEEVNGWIIRR
jgi:hypothetical protein